MVSIEKFTKNYINDFKIIFKKSMALESYDNNFLKKYDNQNFLIKLFSRKYLFIIKLDNSIIGYIWFDSPVNSSLYIQSLFIDDIYIDKLSQNTLDNFNQYLLNYETIDNKRNFIILNSLGFRRVDPFLLMELNLNTYCKNLECLNLFNNITYESFSKTSAEIDDSNLEISLDRFVKGKDETLRCNLQNEIFSNNKRIPLSVDDIVADAKQSYYIDDLCYFIKINTSPIGYGQVIFSEDKYMVVNVCILEDFQNKNLGKILLNQLILSSKKKGIIKLYLKVEENNLSAKKLYKWCGFKKKCYISKWQR